MTLQEGAELPPNKQAKEAMKPGEDIMMIPLHPSDPAKTALIGTGLDRK